MSDVIKRINEATARLEAANVRRTEHLAQAGALEEQARAERRAAAACKVEAEQCQTVLSNLGVQKRVADHEDAAARARAEADADRKAAAAEREKQAAEHEKRMKEADALMERLNKAAPGGG